MRSYDGLARLAIILSVFAGIIRAEVSSEKAGFSSEAEAAVHECSVLKEGVAYAIKAEAICLKGLATYQLQRDFESRVNETSSSARNVKFIVVDSEGGEMRPAIAIARLIENTGADIIVDRVCASSCAQFIFMAGPRKHVVKGGHVLFHGGPLSEEKIASLKLPPAAAESLRRQSKEFIDFYEDRSISIEIVTKPPEDVQKRMSEGELVMWEWSREKLEEFGVKGLIYED